MNSQVKEKWVAALRSGEYQQGNNSLRSNQGFCCLGVLCDLYAKEHSQDWEYVNAYSEQNTKAKDSWSFQEETQFLPEKVMNWAQLEDNNPEVEILDKDGNLIQHEILSMMNDDGVSFSIIADVIEEGL